MILLFVPSSPYFLRHQLASHKLQHDGSHPHPSVHPRSSDENAGENENLAIKNSNEI